MSRYVAESEGGTVIRFINSFLLALHEKEIVSSVNVQRQQMKLMEGKKTNGDFLQYMLERFETDLEFFEMVQLKAENDEARSFFSRIVICGRIVRDIVRRRFFRNI